MHPITTLRLVLVPATVALIDADLESAEALDRFLDAEVPSDWPPGEYDRPAMEFFRSQLAKQPDAVGWYGWYAVHRSVDQERPVLVGSGGYFGPPDAAGTVEVGYSIVPAFRARGFATELLKALVARAFAVPGLLQVVAHTTPSNIGSIRVLERCGFSFIGPGNEPNTVRYGIPGS
jgi:[ribosomal protein S5]-alanine N-acetyltransferase